VYEPELKSERAQATAQRNSVACAPCNFIRHPGTLAIRLARIWTKGAVFGLQFPRSGSKSGHPTADGANASPLGYQHRFAVLVECRHIRQLPVAKFFYDMETSTAMGSSARRLATAPGRLRTMLLTVIKTHGRTGKTSWP